MLKLFGLKPARDETRAPLPVKKYTRFANTHTRTQVDYVAQPAPQPCQIAKATPRRLVGLVATPESAPPSSLTEQLHSDDHISVALLRRALPLRFADIDARTHGKANKSSALL